MASTIYQGRSSGTVTGAATPISILRKGTLTWACLALYIEPGNANSMVEGALTLNAVSTLANNGVSQGDFLRFGAAWAPATNVGYAVQSTQFSAYQLDIEVDLQNLVQCFTTVTGTATLYTISYLFQVKY